MNAAGRRLKHLPEPLAILLARGTHVRCAHRAKPGKRQCDVRRTLNKPINAYVRLPACETCGNKAYRVDLSRELERGRYAKKPCRCYEYPFPHRRGSGLCMHNPIKPSPEKRKEMHEAFADSWRKRRR